MLMTVIAFLVTIGVLVVIHEYGHYRAAVACNVKVLRFSVGFGKVIWRRQGRETEFVLSALPFGGYVKMLDEREGPVDPAEQHRAFNRKPLRQRAFVVAAGPAANLILAVVLYAIVNWSGVLELRPWLAAPQAGSMAAQAGLRSGDEVVGIEVLSPSNAGAASEVQTVRSMGDLQWLFMESSLDGKDVRLHLESRSRADGPVSSRRTVVLPLSRISASEVDAGLLDRIGLSGPYADPVVHQVMADGPAERAGLRAGDRVQSIQGVVPTDAGHLRQLIRHSHAQGEAVDINVTVLRAGQVLNLTLKPVMTEIQGQRIPRIEAALGSAPATVEVSYGLFEGFSRAVTKTWDISVMSVSMLGKMLIGEASLKNLSGPVTIADYAGRSAQMGWIYYVGFLALVSVSLGVLNLLPLPVLDGGHLMYYLFEGVTGRPVSDIWLERLQRGGVAIMLGMMSLALYNDLARVIGAN